MDRGISIEKADVSDLDDNNERLQSGYWARFKERFGWRADAFRLRIEEADSVFLLLTRKLAAGVFLAYVPFGPSIPEPESRKEEFLLSICSYLSKNRGSSGDFLLSQRPIAIRLDLPWERHGTNAVPEPFLPSSHFRKAKQDVQPTSTVVLNLKSGEEELLRSDEI